MDPNAPNPFAQGALGAYRIDYAAQPLSPGLSKLKAQVDDLVLEAIKKQPPKLVLTSNPKQPFIDDFTINSMKETHTSSAVKVTQWGAGSYMGSFDVPKGETLVVKGDLKVSGKLVFEAGGKLEAKFPDPVQHVLDHVMPQMSLEQKQALLKAIRADVFWQEALGEAQ